MKTKIISVVLFLMLFFISGCSKIDDAVFLSIKMENDSKDHDKNPSKYADTGLKVFVNGNFYQFLRFGSSVGPVDKFLMSGNNTIEIQGCTASPLELVICSFKSDHTPIRTVFNQKWINITTGETYQARFRVKKTLPLPIFERKNAKPDRLKAEAEITSIVSNLYQACTASNKEAFIRISLEGYRIHSPSEYPSIMSSVASMFDHLNLKPFPEKLCFIHGSNLVSVYSSFGDFNSVLFSAQTKDSASIGGMDFAYIDDKWIVW